MIKIVCDRCGQEINGKPRYIAFRIKNSIKSPEIFYPYEFCEKCTEEIKAIIIDATIAPTAVTVALAAGSTESSPAANQITNKKPAKRKNSTDIEKIIALRKSGWNDNQIAEEMGVEPKSVTNAIYRYRKSQRSGQKPIGTGNALEEYKGTNPLAAGQDKEDKTKEKKQIDMGKVNALRDAGWSIGRIAEDMNIPPEDIAEKIYSRKVQEQKSAKT